MNKARVDQGKYLRAKAHVASVKGFYIQISVFVAFISGLFTANYASGGTACAEARST